MPIGPTRRPTARQVRSAVHSAPALHGPTWRSSLTSVPPITASVTGASWRAVGSARVARFLQWYNNTNCPTRENCHYYAVELMFEQKSFRFSRRYCNYEYKTLETLPIRDAANGMAVQKWIDMIESAHRLYTPSSSGNPVGQPLGQPTIGATGQPDAIYSR